MADEDSSPSNVGAEGAATWATISLLIMASCSAENGASSEMPVPELDSSLMILDPRHMQMGNRQRRSKTKMVPKSWRAASQNATATCLEPLLCMFPACTPHAAAVAGSPTLVIPLLTVIICASILYVNS